MTLALLSDLANHLWQSTLVLGGACGLAWLLRHNSAQARFRIWLAASVKFVVPFAPLVAVGRAVGWPSATTMPQPTLSTALNTLNQPFVLPHTMASDVSVTPVAVPFAPSWPDVFAAIWLTGSVVLLAVWTIRWLRVAAIVRASRPLTDPGVVTRLRRAEALIGVRRPLRAVVSTAAIEPGVFGIARPVLIWPRDLGAHLSGDQIDGVLLHELAHVRRRDNLTAMLHIVVETIFWFVPLVWWLERRLVRERELACDQAAVIAGSDPRSYAEGILRTCELYAVSPIVCVAGVTGSDLKQRIAAIVGGHVNEAVGIVRRVIIASTAATALALPIALGVMQTPMLLAQAVPAVSPLPTFEVASIKRHPPDEPRARFGPRGSQLEITNYDLLNIIRNAWGIQGNQIIGGPDWARSDTERFDIMAKFADGTKPADMLLMVQALLADRFKLRVHKETRQLPVYALVMARADRRLGPKMTPAAFDCNALRAAMERGERPPEPPRTSARPVCGAQGSPGRFLIGGYDIANFGRNLSGVLDGRPVIDRTGLTGIFDMELTWTPESPARDGAPTPDPNGVSLFTALQEQLGLKAEATTGPVEVLVIDSAERPTID